MVRPDSEQKYVRSFLSKVGREGITREFKCKKNDGEAEKPLLSKRRGLSGGWQVVERGYSVPNVSAIVTFAHAVMQGDLTRLSEGNGQ